MNFEIKTDIPVPAAKPTGRPAAKYPFEDMNVKESFFVALGKDAEKTVLERMRTNIARWKKLADLKDRKFRVEPIEHPDTLEPAVGVWRVL